MPQDSDGEREAKIPFDSKITLKVNELKRLLERKKREVQIKIDSLKEERTQLKMNLLRINVLYKDESFRNTSNELIVRLSNNISELEMKDKEH
jgi:hypothetical protein